MTLINKKFNPIDFAPELITPINIVQAKDDVVALPYITKKFFLLLNCTKQYFEVPQKDHDFFGDEKQLIDAVTQF